MGNLTRALLISITLMIPALSSAQEYLPREGKNPVREGGGGNKKNIDGIDFWADGAPPRKSRLIRYIHADGSHLKAG